MSDTEFIERRRQDRRRQPQAQGLGRAGQRIQVADVVAALVADGLLDPAEGGTATRYASLGSSDQHALVSLAQRKLRDARPPHRVLDLETLTEWFAGRVGLDYVHIDPLRINLSRVADVMSSQYATRFRILPL